MRAYLEVRRPGVAETVDLEGVRVVIGKAAGNDLVLDDPAVSRVHLVIETVGPGWSVTDMGSRNGTYLNGERLLATKVLRPGDEVGVGSTSLVFRLRGAAAEPSETATAVAPPRLTPRERDVLGALCRPVLRSSVLTEPASVRAVADELVVTESAVKKVLGRLYDKFGLHDADRRRGRLVAEALARGAVDRLA